MSNSSKIICALDANDISKVLKMVSNIKYDIIYKIGMEFFYNFGLEGVYKLKKVKKNIKIFLDLKLHDIPNTVSNAIVPLILNINPYMITIHVTGGDKMMKATMKTIKTVAEKKSIKPPLIFGVTVLTSLGNQEVESLGWGKSIEETVVKYSLLAKNSGLDGIVCSALETKKVKELCGSNFYVITPGIRLSDNKDHDQARVVTPQDAFRNGSDFIVMGRPIINSLDPNNTIKQLVDIINNEK